MPLCGAKMPLCGAKMPLYGAKVPLCGEGQSGQRQPPRRWPQHWAQEVRMRKEILGWDDVDGLIDSLLPQLRGAFDAMIMITRGGIIPGGLLSEALDIRHILTAAVNFPIDLKQAKLLAWPDFIQFPDDDKVAGRRTLIVDDVWGSGRQITAVKSRVEAAGGYPELCVLHYNPTRTLFTKLAPHYYAAITDAYVVYPWELDRGLEAVLAGSPQVN